MIKRNKIWLLLVISVLLIPRITFGQSDPHNLLDKCASNLGTYNYIKSLYVDVNPWKKKTNSEYSYVFSKCSTYILIACNENAAGGKMIINIYDRNHIIVASTYDEKKGKYYPDLLYQCTTTGVYYIKVSFEGTKRGHGICILGFNKDKE
jgi:hypothetical protein